MCVDGVAAMMTSLLILTGFALLVMMAVFVDMDDALSGLCCCCNAEDLKRHAGRNL